MLNYNQKYINDVIATLTDNTGNAYDASLDSAGFFRAVGKITSGDLTRVKNASQIALWCVKPNSYLNLTGTTTFKDDTRTIATANFTGNENQQVTTISNTIDPSLSFTNQDTNITFSKFGGTDDFGNAIMTKPIDPAHTKTGASLFTATVNVPDDVWCNYKTGDYKGVGGQGVNLLFTGNLKKGDTISFKRNNRADIFTTLLFDTDAAFRNVGMTNSCEIIYTHANQPDVPVTPVTPPAKTITFTSEDEGAKWVNDTMVDSGTSTQTNIITIQKGYKLVQNLKVQVTDTNSDTERQIFNIGNDRFDGDDSQKNQWTVPIPTGFVKFDIEAGNTEYKEYNLSPTIQNAKLIEPTLTENDWGDSNYFLDPKHNTITIKANEGYSFETDGSLTYQQDETNIGTITIPATHTDTVTVSLPSDINWSIQKTFKLTIGASKPAIVENSGGFTNIYKADYNNLLKFSNEVIVKITGGTLHPSEQAYDVTQYINNLVVLPFNVTAGSTSPIVAGNETFTTELPTVDNNYLTVDLGKIVVDEQYKNGYDYYKVKTRLMLPYTNMIELDPNHVINKTVSIKYIVNVVNGDTTINLYNGDDLFYSDQVNIANEVPFITSARRGSQYAVINRLKTMFRNEIQQPYIIIEQPTPILNSDYYTTNEKGTLQGYTGNVKVSLLNNMDINAIELNTLQQILETGVKIK